jgi:hypothetical protein
VALIYAGFPTSSRFGGLLMPVENVLRIQNSSQREANTEDSGDPNRPLTFSRHPEVFLAHDVPRDRANGAGGTPICKTSLFDRCGRS